jgi:DNA (cytosine-5)-methyltransferase 1
VLDGFCGVGGSSRGYVDAGHDVTGVDIEPQPNYLKSGSSRFVRMDMIELLADPTLRQRYDFAHVSPPCQRKSKMTNCRPGLAATYPDLVGAVRILLRCSGLPYVIEQPEHGTPLLNPVTLCGWMFGYETYRHRCFEAGGFTLDVPPMPSPEMRGRRRSCGWPHPVPAAKAGHWTPGRFVSVAGHERVGLTRPVMGIDWSNREELAEAVPPYMTRWIGEQLVGSHK